MSKLSPEQFQAIFDRIEAGETLNKILPTIPHPDTQNPMSRGVFFRWLEADLELQDQYTRATSLRADSWAEQVHDVSSDGSLPADHRRVAADGLKWVAAKAAPKKYGDRLELGGDVTIRDKRVIDRAVEAAKAADE